MDETDRISGAFFGQVIGDALGVHFEFGNVAATKISMATAKNNRKTAIFFGLIKTGPEPLLPILGTDRIEAGQFTDDTEMALSLARSIIAMKKFDKVDVACAYAYWLCRTNPKTAGLTTKKALRCQTFTLGKKLTPNWRDELSNEEKAKALETITKNVAKHNTQSLSNGCLMRISPLAIAFRHLNIKELRSLAKEDASITHCHPIALDAVATYVVALAALLNGDNKEMAFTKAYNSAETKMVKELMDDAKTHAIPVKLYQPDPTLPIKTTLGDDNFMGYLGVALQSTFYELIYAESFASGMENVIARGGDTDTNGCIVGAILGARFGLAAIPEEWINDVKKAPPCLYSWENIRKTINMNFLSIKDVDTLIPELANICKEE